MKSLSYTIAFVVICTSFLFPQLDSVYYLGPSSGSVSGGAVQTTDNFTNDDSFTGNTELEVNPLQSNSYDNYGDMISGWDKSLLPEYVYLEDSEYRSNGYGNGGQTVLLNSFPGIPMTNFIPPDPVIAAGPEHIIICANSVFRILDKEGHVLKIISAANWWAPAWPDENGDPQVVYDFYSQRWVLVWMQVNTSAQTAGNLIAYSDDENPLGLWYMYRLDTKKHGTVPSNTWGDYPHIGFDEQAIYIMTRCIDFSGAGLQYNKIRMINKSELYNSNGGPLTYTDIWDIRKPGEGIAGARLDCIHPAVSYTPGSGAWFYWARGVYGGAPVSSDFYAIYKIDNPLSNPVLTGKVLPVQTYTSPPLANQLGGGLGIETIGWITARPVVRDGFLYAAHDIQNSLYPAYSSIKYMKVDLSTVSLVDNVEYGLQGYFYLFPALMVDKEHNIAITFSRSADDEYIGSFYSTRFANDPPGLSASLPIAEGKGNYVLTYNGAINRWGDYFGIYLDPANEYEFWMISEYAAATNIWSTYVGHVRMAPFIGPHAFANPDSAGFGDVEVGTTSSFISLILSNYGDADLVINSIPAAVGDFSLETSINFPYTLTSYDSLELEFSFSPSSTGNSIANFPVNTNDPAFQGFIFTGNGYEMHPAFNKTVYASSGFQNSGNIITIDKISGAGVLVGPSLFNEIKSITIHPQTGIIYGLVAGNSSSELVRVNAFSGDAYVLYTLNVPNLSAIAFDIFNMLYAVSNTGEFYTVDLSNGSTNFIVDAEGSYSSINFEPVTNELWATSRALIPPNNDLIFKVNLTNGDTSVVGHTGLGKLTNAIAFDENSNLFGVIGTAGEVNDFISINTSNGVGSIIGSTGFKNLLGLAYTNSSPNSIGEDTGRELPGKYSLFQNYPNPFNPFTKIKYNIPSNSGSLLSRTVFVQLKVYDVLGTEIRTIVSEEKSAGSYEVDFDATGLPSGLYFYRLMVSGNNKNSHDNYIETKKMLLLK